MLISKLGQREGCDRLLDPEGAASGSLRGQPFNFARKIKLRPREDGKQLCEFFHKLFPTAQNSSSIPLCYVRKSFRTDRRSGDGLDFGRPQDRLIVVLENVPIHLAVNKIAMVVDAPVGRA